MVPAAVSPGIGVETAVEATGPEPSRSWERRLTLSRTLSALFEAVKLVPSAFVNVKRRPVTSAAATPEGSDAVAIVVAVPEVQVADAP